MISDELLDEIKEVYPPELNLFTHPTNGYPVTYHWDFCQRSEDWMEIRSLRLGGSSAQAIQAKPPKALKHPSGLGKGVHTKVNKAIAIELGIAEPDDFVNDDMERGIMLEPQAIEKLEQMYFCEAYRPGYVSMGIHFGCSPDAILGTANGLMMAEIKCPRPDKFYEISLGAPSNKGDMDQLQWNMYVTQIQKGIMVRYTNTLEGNKGIVITEVEPDRDLWNVFDEKIPHINKLFREVYEFYN